MAGSISYKCPNCGGELVYAPGTGGFHCPYCSTDFTEEKIKALYEQREAEEGSKGQAAEEKAAAREELVQYNCPNCGAEIVTEESTAATFCYFCHNPVVLVGRLSGAEAPQYVLPFGIDRKKALGIFQNWIKKKKFVPRAFYDEKQIEKFTGVYFPYLLYSCEAHSSLSGVGTRVERHEHGDIEEIVTSKYQIERNGDLPVRKVARNALKKANRVLAESVQPFATEELKPFSPSYLSGFVAERRDMESASIQAETRQEVEQYALASLRSSVSVYQGLPVGPDNIRLDHEQLEYALMPVWTMTYRAPGSSKLYYFSLNGQSGKVVGELPVDNGKLFCYFLRIFIPLFAVLLALMYFIS